MERRHLASRSLPPAHGPRRRVPGPRARALRSAAAAAPPRPDRLPDQPGQSGRRRLLLRRRALQPAPAESELLMRPIRMLVRLAAGACAAALFASAAAAQTAQGTDTVPREVLKSRRNVRTFLNRNVRTADRLSAGAAAQGVTG